jgi:hypothetical protein
MVGVGAFCSTDNIVFVGTGSFDFTDTVLADGTDFCCCRSAGTGDPNREDKDFGSGVPKMLDETCACAGAGDPNNPAPSTELKRDGVTTGAGVFGVGGSGSLLPCMASRLNNPVLTDCRAREGDPTMSHVWSQFSDARAY